MNNDIPLYPVQARLTVLLPDPVGPMTLKDVKLTVRRRESYHVRYDDIINF